MSERAERPEPVKAYLDKLDEARKYARNNGKDPGTEDPVFDKLMDELDVLWDKLGPEGEAYVNKRNMVHCNTGNRFLIRIDDGTNVVKFFIYDLDPTRPFAQQLNKAIEDSELRDINEAVVSRVNGDDDVRYYGIVIR